MNRLGDANVIAMWLTVFALCGASALFLSWKEWLYHKSRVNTIYAAALSVAILSVGSLGVLIWMYLKTRNEQVFPLGWKPTHDEVLIAIVMVGLDILCLASAIAVALRTYHKVQRQFQPGHFLLTR